MKTNKGDSMAKVNIELYMNKIIDETNLIGGL